MTSRQMPSKSKQPGRKPSELFTDHLIRTEELEDVQSDVRSKLPSLDVRGIRVNVDVRVQIYHLRNVDGCTGFDEWSCVNRTIYEFTIRFLQANIGEVGQAKARGVGNLVFNRWTEGRAEVITVWIRFVEGVRVFVVTNGVVRGEGHLRSQGVH